MLSYKFRNRSNKQKPLTRRTNAFETDTSQNLIIRAINAPFTIWLLSAIAISVFGTYFSTHQQCLRDADQLRDNFGRTQDEFFSRSHDIANAIGNANSVEALKTQLTHIRYQYSQFKDKSMHDLYRDWISMSTQIREDRAHFTPVINWSGDDLPYIPLVIYGDASNLDTNIDLKKLKIISNKYIKFIDSLESQTILTHIAPACSTSTVVEALFMSGHPHILQEYVFQPDYDELKKLLLKNDTKK